jgi:hypothetical protein
MPDVSPQIAEITRKAKITDYLRRRGVELVRAGKNMRCRCPLPGHSKDNTPSFYVRTMPDGGEMFKCFGSCGLAGNIFTLIRLMEGVTNGVIVRRLADQAGIKLDGRRPVDSSDEIKTDPLPYETDAAFSIEDDMITRASLYVLDFMQTHGTPDAIEKGCLFYKKIDEARGDDDKIYELMKFLKNSILEYGAGEGT